MSVIRLRCEEDWTICSSTDFSPVKNFTVLLRITLLIKATNNIDIPPDMGQTGCYAGRSYGFLYQYVNRMGKPYNKSRISMALRRVLWNTVIWDAQD